MYTPEHFREPDVGKMHALMRAASFATLITTGEAGITATHLPTVLKDDAGPFGAVEAHMARANDQWKTASASDEALIIFTGPHAYIHPGWYPSKAIDGKVVPSWNYAAVHAYGRLEVIDDADWLKAHVAQLSAQEESVFDEPWSVSDAPEQFIDVMVRGIVGVRLVISRLEGKWKMSQNRGEADRMGVIEGLRSRDGDSSAAEVADLVEAASNSIK